MDQQYIPIDLILPETFSFSEEVIKPIRESIAEQGVHHPILVVETEPIHEVEIDNPKFKIIAGKKRFVALQQLGTKEIPVKIYPANLTKDQIEDISLHENLRRQNLTWYEQVEMELQLHDLRQRMHGAKTQGARSDKGAKGWTQTDTARELGISIGSLSQDLNLARAVMNDPSLKNVKDKDTAMRLIKTAARRAEAEAFALLPNEQDFMDQAFLGDSYEILKRLPAGSFDCCITDPPWSTYDRDEDLTANQDDLLPIFREVFRLLKTDSFLFVITSSIDLHHYQTELPKIGFKIQNYPLIWFKDSTITHGRRNYEYARDYEPIILAVKGNPLLTSSTEISSILNYRNLHYTKMIHPNEKPPELLEQLIRNSTFEGMSILDPFSGSGVTLEVAKRMNRHYVGCEKDKKFYDGIVRRLG